MECYAEVELEMDHKKGHTFLATILSTTPEPLNLSLLSSLIYVPIGLGDPSCWPSLESVRTLLGRVVPRSALLITWEFVRNAEFHIPPQSCQISACILTRYLDDLSAY